MKKIYLSIIAVGLFFTACSNEDALNNQPQGEKITQTIKVNVADFESENGTRTSVTTAGEFSWSAGDQLGVFPLQSTLDAAGQTSQQILFKLNSNTPATTATFNGTGWGLVTGGDFKYFAYYPFDNEAKHGEVAIKYSDNLNQTENNSTAHLGVNDFLYAPAIQPASIEEAEFQFQHISALVNLTINVPVEAQGKTFTKVVLSASTPIFTIEGTYNPSTTSAESAPTVTPTTTTNKLNLLLNGGEGIIDDTSVINAWFLMAPVAFDNTAVTIGIYTKDGEYYEATKNIANPLESQDFVNYAVDVNPAIIGGTDLSVNGTANCYQVRQGNCTYSFIGRIKGNGYDPLDNVNHNANAAIDILHASGAVVLWETVNTNVAPAAGTIIKDAKLRGNRIYITTPETFTEGNALVALYKDREGGTLGQYDAEYDEILWSWHIWATTTDFEETAQDLGGVKMMDRNLGALSNGDMYMNGENVDFATPGLALGFLYQWGRPFPIIGGCADASTKATKGVNMATVNAGGATWGIDDNAVESTEKTGTLAYSIQNPMTFICASAEAVGTKGEGDWYYWRGDVYAPAFWGEAKTMYDPCPVGWKVPGRNSASQYLSVWSKNFTPELTAYVSNKGRYLITNPAMFYPYCGFRGKNVTVQTGELNAIGSGYYWTSLLDGRNGRNMNITTGVIPTTSHARAYAYSIRPCQDISN